MCARWRVAGWREDLHWTSWSRRSGLPLNPTPTSPRYGDLHVNGAARAVADARLLLIDAGGAVHQGARNLPPQPAIRPSLADGTPHALGLSSGVTFRARRRPNSTHIPGQLWRISGRLRSKSFQFRCSQSGILLGIGNRYALGANSIEDPHMLEEEVQTIQPEGRVKHLA